MGWLGTGCQGAQVSLSPCSGVAFTPLEHLQPGKKLNRVDFCNFEGNCYKYWKVTSPVTYYTTGKLIFFFSQLIFNLSLVLVPYHKGVSEC